MLADVRLACSLMANVAASWRIQNTLKMVVFVCCHNALVLVAKCNQSSSNLINSLRCNQLDPDRASITACI
jgi:hypothetical protein